MLNQYDDQYFGYAAFKVLFQKQSCVTESSDVFVVVLVTFV